MYRISHMNKNRARWAGEALRTFQAETGSDREDAVSDLLADLMHWCAQEAIDFAIELQRAQKHFNVEKRGVE